MPNRKQDIMALKCAFYGGCLPMVCLNKLQGNLGLPLFRNRGRHGSIRHWLAVMHTTFAETDKQMAPET